MIRWTIRWSIVFVSGGSRKKNIMAGLAPSALVFLVISILITALRTLAMTSTVRCTDWFGCLIGQTLGFLLFATLGFAYALFVNWVHSQNYVMVGWLLSGLGIYLALGTLGATTATSTTTSTKTTSAATVSVK